MILNRFFLQVIVKYYFFVLQAWKGLLNFLVLIYQVLLLPFFLFLQFQPSEVREAKIKKETTVQPRRS
jgi:hypothetical protein